MAEELRITGRDQREGPYQILYPMSEGCCPNLTVFVRSRTEASDVLPVFREILRTLDPEQPIQELHTATEDLAEPERTARLLALLVTILAALGAATAGVGTFGVLGYAVRRRDRELGVRKALGAEPRTLVRKVVREGLVMGAAGVAVGATATALLSPTTEALLYGIDPHSSVYVAVPALLLLAVVAAAALVPARRVASVDPVEVLRAD